MVFPTVIKPAIRDGSLLCSSLEMLSIACAVYSAMVFRTKTYFNQLSEGGKIISLGNYIGFNFRSSCEFHIAIQDNLIHFEGLTHALCNGPGPAGQHSLPYDFSDCH
jgi:hypothetical protein